MKCKFCYKDTKEKFCSEDCKELYYFRKKLDKEDTILSKKNEQNKGKYYQYKKLQDKTKINEKEEEKIREYNFKREEKLKTIREEEESIREQNLLKQEKREQKILARREKENLKLQSERQRIEKNSVILKNFNNIRNSYNLKLTDISEMLNISRQAVSSWSNTKHRIPVARIKELSRLLNISEEKFYEGVEENKEISNEDL